MLAPNSLIYLLERTSRSSANSIRDHTNVSTKKVANQFFQENRIEKTSLPFASFQSLQTADGEIAAKSLKPAAVRIVQERRVGERGKRSINWHLGYRIILFE